MSTKKALKAIVKELARLNTNLEAANELQREASSEPSRIAEELASIREEMHDVAGMLEQNEVHHDHEL